MFIFSKLFDLFTGVGQQPRRIRDNFNSDDDLPPSSITLEQIAQQQNNNRYIQNDIDRMDLENQEEFQRQMFSEQQQQQQLIQAQNDMQFTNMSAEQNINDSIQSMNDCTQSMNDMNNINNINDMF